MYTKQIKDKHIPHLRAVGDARKKKQKKNPVKTKCCRVVELQHMSNYLHPVNTETKRKQITNTGRRAPRRHRRRKVSVPRFGQQMADLKQHPRPCERLVPITAAQLHTCHAVLSSLHALPSPASLAAVILVRRLSKQRIFFLLLAQKKSWCLFQGN